MTTPSPCSCVLCRKVTSNLGIAAHISQAHGNGKSSATLAANAARRGQKPWNAGISSSEETKAKQRAAASKLPRSEETKSRIRLTAAKNRKSGGFREGGGKGKKGKFKGIHCDSSWELAFLIWAFDQEKSIERVRTPRPYVFEGKKKLYYPDFLVNGEVYEIKGWKTPQWEAKHEQNKDVIVLGLEDIQPMIDLAVAKYGRDFTIAYDE